MDIHVNETPEKLHLVTHIIITVMHTRCIRGSNMCSLPNVSQVCELCVSIKQIHIDKPHCAAIGPESTQCCKPAPFWHIMAHLRGCRIL